MTDRLALALAELVDALRAEVAAGAVPAADEPERLLSVDEAAHLIGVGRTTLYAEMQAGRCRSIRVGRRRLVPASAVAEYAEGREGRATSRPEVVERVSHELGELDAAEEFLDWLEQRYRAEGASPEVVELVMGIALHREIAGDTIRAELTRREQLGTGEDDPDR